MRDGTSPIGIGLSLLQTDMVTRRAVDHSPTPPSFVTHTMSSTSSVAPSFVSYLPQHAKATPTGIGLLNDDLLISKSLNMVSSPAPLNAALVAGSVSLLMGVVCILGFICYRKQRCGKGHASFISNCRTMTIPGAPKDQDDLEASVMAFAHSADNGFARNRSSVTDNDRNAICLSISVWPDSIHTHPSQSLTTETEVLRATPLVGHIRQRSQDLSTISTSSTFCSPEPSDSNFVMLTPEDPELKAECVNQSVAVTESNELEEEDLASVVLSSLQSNTICQTAESYNDIFSASYSMLASGKVSTFGHDSLPDSSHILAPFDCDDSFLEAAAFSETPSSLHSSPTSASDSDFLATPTLTPRPFSISSLLPYQSQFALYTKRVTFTAVPHRLLELNLDAELDLRSWLGLDKETRIFESEATDTDAGRIPELVTTDSQDTVTGTDESYDHNTVQASSESPYAHDAHQGHQFQKSKDLTNVHYCAESRVAVFKHTATRDKLLHPSILFPEVATGFLPLDAQLAARTLSPSSSSVSSSTSIATLQLPSFCSTRQKPLVDEVLPPPSIIVSVPTDDSLVPESRGSTRFSVMNIATGTQVERCNGTNKGVGNIVKVIYDPLDEVEDQAWDTYERRSFMDASSHCAMAAASVGFTESWMASSESSELDIEKAIAEFPLPPVRAYSANPIP